jgi:hypothetical protein
VDEQLHEVRLLTKGSGLDRDARLSLRGDVARIEEAMAQERLHPQAVAFFSCSGRGRGRTLRKPDYAAGMREYTTRNKAEQLDKRHYRAVAERLDEEARGHRFDIVAVGGHEHEVPGVPGPVAAECA